MNFFNKLIVATLPAVPKPIIRQFASRYIAGEEMSDAVRVVRELNAQGAMATLDVLGEDVHSRETAEASTQAILNVFDAIREFRLDSNVSVKLTQLGLKLDPAFCLENTRRLAVRARDLGNYLRIDMEDSTCTDATLWVYRELRKEFSNVGIVLQAYLRRTGRDAGELIDAGIGNFRLCKGIYIEAEEIAFKAHEEINRNYLEVLSDMFRRNAYVGIATHDDALIDGAYRLIGELKLPKSAYEFQMLLGVRPELRRRLLGDGHRLRVYVPFGGQWYQYSIRRFKENPQVAGHVVKALLHRLRRN
jgi:proline dehydrogenase